MLTTATALAMLALPVVVLGPRPGLEIVHPMAEVLLGGVVTAAAVALLLVPALVTMGGRPAEGAPAPSRERVTQEDQQSMPAPGSAS